MDTIIEQQGTLVRAYCKGGWAHKRFTSKALAVAAAHRLRGLDDEEHVYEATADWDLEDDDHASTLQCGECGDFTFTPVLAHGRVFCGTDCLSDYEHGAEHFGRDDFESY